MISVEVPLWYSLHDVIIMVHSPASRGSIRNGSHQWIPWTCSFHCGLRVILNQRHWNSWCMMKLHCEWVTLVSFHRFYIDQKGQLVMSYDWFKCIQMSCFLFSILVSSLGPWNDPFLIMYIFLLRPLKTPHDQTILCQSVVYNTIHRFWLHFHHSLVRCRICRMYWNWRSHFCGWRISGFD